MSLTPYIGLRSFGREEKQLFFGREQHSNDLLQRLNQQHFLAVVGDSGCGKSSLVKAGLIPSLQAGFLTEAGSHWRIAEIRSGDAPFANLAKELCQEGALGDRYRNELLDQQRLTTGPFSLHELLAAKPLANNAKLLIVCDQFEELFRYAKQHDSDEAAAFAALLLASSNAYPLLGGGLSHSVYVIVTMRSDYLGECSRFAGLAEAINQGLYLTPRLNRQQLRLAIEKPALVGGGKVQPALIGKLLNETGSDPDQLPLLQHLLMRLWDGAVAKTSEAYTPDGICIPSETFNSVMDTSTAENVQTGQHAPSGGMSGNPADSQAVSITTTPDGICIPSETFNNVMDTSAAENVQTGQHAPSGGMSGNPADSQAISITLADYQAENIQTLKHALSAHADQAYRELDEAQRLIAEQIFRRLTGQDSSKADTRDPTTVQALMDLTGQDLEQLGAVLNVFRQNGRSFLLPPEATALTPGTIIDITHESLIRNWALLETWVKEEADSARIYQRLEEDALLRKQSGYDFYRSPELENALAWQEKNQPTKVWASRYGQHFDLAMAFLQDSLAAQQAEQLKEKEQQDQQRELDRARLKFRNLRSSLVVAVALMLVAGYAWYHAQQTEQQRVVDLYKSHLTHASLLAKNDDYAKAKKILVETDEFDDQLPDSLRHARNLLHSYTQIKGGEAEQVYSGAGYSLMSVAISPDGKLLAAGGEHGTLVIFDAVSGELVQRLLGHATDGELLDSTVFSVVFTPSGEQLVTGGTDNKIIVWQRDKTAAQSSKFQKQLELRAPNKVIVLRISPDGKLLATGGIDNVISLWDLRRGKLERRLTEHHGIINGLDFSPDGRYLASGSSDGVAIIWDIKTNKPLQFLTGHADEVMSLSFSADSTMLATASSDKTVFCWDVARGKLRRVLIGHTQNVGKVAWLGDYLLSGSSDKNIRLWDSRSGVSLRVLQGHESGINNFALHGGQLWSASDDGTLRRWLLTLPFAQAQALPTAPSSAVITPSLAQVAVGFANGDLALYDAQKPEPIWQKSKAHNGVITRLAVTADGSTLASGSFDNTAKLWQVQAGPAGTALHQSQTLEGHTDAIHALAFSSDAKTLATAGFDGQIGLFTVDQSQPARFINPAHQGKVASVEFGPGGSRLVSSGNEDRSLKLWDLGKAPPTAKDFPLAKDGLLWAGISPDGQKLVSVGHELAVNVYDRLGTKNLYHLAGHQQAVFRAIFAPDSQQLATVSGDTTVKFWQLDTNQELFSLALPTEDFNLSPVWDFDFRCLKDRCLVAVPLVRGQLQLYQLGYERKLTEDSAERQRQQTELWRLYLADVDKLLNTQALPAAGQKLFEAGQIAERFARQFPNAPELKGLTARSDCQRQKLQVLSNPQNPPLGLDCEKILDAGSSVTGFNELGLSYYRQKRYLEAQTVFAKGLVKFPEDLFLFSIDAELALVQDDKPRLQQRLDALQKVYTQKEGLYADKYPAIMQFFAYLADPQQAPQAVLDVIGQTDKAVVFDWDFSDMQPALKRLSPERQKTAALFIDYFSKRSDLDSLKKKLSP